MVLQVPLLIKFLLLLEPCDFPDPFLEEGLLHSLRVGLVLSALRKTVGTAAGIDTSEEDTRQKLISNSKQKGEYEDGLLFWKALETPVKIKRLVVLGDVHTGKDLLL